MTWRWATRRHPNKNAAWVKHKYYTTQGNNNWVFFGQEYSKKQSLYLFSPTTVSIERHVKIKSEANPYDPTFAAYFSNRRRHGSSSPSPSVIEKVLA
jgi:RNA-directed DNA polymerase